MYPNVAAKRLALAAAIWAAVMPPGCAIKGKSLKPVWNHQDSLAVSASSGFAASKTLLESPPSTDKKSIPKHATQDADSDSTAVASDHSNTKNKNTSAIPASFAQNPSSAAAHPSSSQPVTSLSLAMSQAPRDPTVDPTEFQDISLESVLRIAMTSSP